MNVPDSGTVVLLADRVMESFEPEELEALRGSLHTLAFTN
jgi:hypothetical protein